MAIMQKFAKMQKFMVLWITFIFLEKHSSKIGSDFLYPQDETYALSKYTYYKWKQILKCRYFYHTT